MEQIDKKEEDLLVEQELKRLKRLLL